MVAMKRKLIIIAVLVISLVASYILCNTKQNDADIDPVKVEEYTAVLENSVDLDSIAGTYCGVLPPNVETILTLNADGTYRLKRKSANESDSCEVLNGIFKVIDGSILMLEHPSSGDNIFYKVKNDSGIILIDSFGNEPKARDSKLYILKNKMDFIFELISEYSYIYNNLYRIIVLKISFSLEKSCIKYIFIKDLLYFCEQI